MFVEGTAKMMSFRTATRKHMTGLHTVMCPSRKRRLVGVLACGSSTYLHRALVSQNGARRAVGVLAGACARRQANDKQHWGKHQGEWWKEANERSELRKESSEWRSKANKQMKRTKTPSERHRSERREWTEQRHEANEEPCKRMTKSSGGWTGQICSRAQAFAFTC